MSRTFRRNKRRNLKSKCLTFLGGKRCAKCGVDWLPQACYDFHHRNRWEKKANISAMISSGKPFKEIRSELDKCEVVCKNCHALTHSPVGKLF